MTQPQELFDFFLEKSKAAGVPAEQRTDWAKTAALNYLKTRTPKTY